MKQLSTIPMIDIPSREYFPAYLQNAEKFITNDLFSLDQVAYAPNR